MTLDWSVEGRRDRYPTLNLKPEVEAGLLAQAQASGMTVEEYLLSLVEGVVLPAAPTTLSASKNDMAPSLAANGKSHPKKHIHQFLAG